MIRARPAEPRTRLPREDAIPDVKALLSRRRSRATRIRTVSTDLSIQRSDDARGVVLTLVGELDVVSAPELERMLSEVLGQPHTRVMLDLNGLRFVDSAGVSVLIKAKQHAESGGRTLVLRRPTEQLERVFSLVGLADWLEIED
jgi:anti-anti-sigma factor